jgi:hypothetical protein
MASTACFLLLILTWRTKIFGSDWSILTSDRSPETFETRIGSLAMVPVTFYSKTREGKTASWVQTNENNNNVPVKSVKEIRKFWSFSMSQNLSFFPYLNASKKNKYTNLWDLNGNEIDDLKSGDHFSTDSVLKQHLFLFVLSIMNNTLILWLYPSINNTLFLLALSTRKQYLRLCSVYL